MEQKKMDVCPYAKKCGSCDYQGIPYEKQLEKKEKMVRDLLKDFGKTETILGMKNPYHYRNKVHAVFAYDKGKILSGVYRERTHQVVNIDSCQIENEKAGAIIQTIKKLAKSFKYKIYDEDTKYGLLRHVLVRTGYATGQILVVVVLASPILPAKNNFVKALREAHPEITSIVLNVNDKKTSMVLGERNITLYGKGYIEDEICGNRFRISPNSFYQVNPEQTEILYNKAVELAGLTGEEIVLDAYCGTGTIGITAAAKAKHVIGVELNKDAVKDAIVNAKNNKIENARFFQGDAGEFMVEMAQEGQKADVVFMDPPRSGSDEKFLKSLIRMAPKKVVYISCGPDTLARDLKMLTKNGYKMKTAVPVDLFPFTKHCEAITLLQR